MPTYEYRCEQCARNFDVVQSFHDDPIDVCPTCGSPVRKVFSSVGIVFKGSGFYKNDSRSASSSTSPAAGTSTEAAPTPAAPAKEAAPVAPAAAATPAKDTPKPAASGSSN
jgi:putative FmdB family regulatory protein